MVWGASVMRPLSCLCPCLCEEIFVAKFPHVPNDRRFCRPLDADRIVAGVQVERNEGDTAQLSISREECHAFIGIPDGTAVVGFYGKHADFGSWDWEGRFLDGNKIGRSAVSPCGK